MEKRTVKYNLINIAVIVAMAVLFVLNYMDMGSLFAGVDARHILVVVVTVALVHLIKAFRLYLALYGSDIKFVTYLKTYCKVTPVSVVLPYKLGEFFRMYCYGVEVKSLIKGIIIVILDRFMDTTALVTVILLVWIFNGGKLTGFVYILILFLIFALLIYLVFPGVYHFWKMFLLRAKATEAKLATLKFLEILNSIYKEIAGVTKGRGILLYFMSLVAWTVEIGSLALLNGISKTGDLNATISAYLSSAMGTGNTPELNRFIFISVILMVVLYVVIKIVETVLKKKEQV